jgi:hypothetical protein
MPVVPDPAAWGGSVPEGGVFSNPSRSTPARQLALAVAALRGAHRDLELAAAAGDDPVARLGHQSCAVAGVWAAGAVLADLLADTGPAASPAGPRLSLSHGCQPRAGTRIRPRPVRSDSVAVPDAKEMKMLIHDLTGAARPADPGRPDTGRSARESRGRPGLPRVTTPRRSSSLGE